MGRIATIAVNDLVPAGETITFRRTGNKAVVLKNGKLQFNGSTYAFNTLTTKLAKRGYPLGISAYNEWEYIGMRLSDLRKDLINEATAA